MLEQRCGDRARLSLHFRSSLCMSSSGVGQTVSCYPSCTLFRGWRCTHALQDISACSKFRQCTGKQKSD